MSDVRIVAHGLDGSEVDVTEGVQALYDHCVSSMDWGSGFLTIEDATGIIKLAQTCGFLMPEGAAAEFEEYARHFGTGKSNIICAICGESVQYSYSNGWRHAGHNPGHAVQLWR